MSSSQVKNKGKLKESVNKFKSKVKAKVENVKVGFEKYKSELNNAYKIGYQHGWEDSQDIPDRFGSATVASIGYKNGITNRRKTVKYTSQYNKTKKQ